MTTNEDAPVILKLNCDYGIYDIGLPMGSSCLRTVLIVTIYNVHPSDLVLVHCCRLGYVNQKNARADMTAPSIII